MPLVRPRERAKKIREVESRECLLLYTFQLVALVRMGRVNWARRILAHRNQEIAKSSNSVCLNWQLVHGRTALVSVISYENPTPEDPNSRKRQKKKMCGR
jgi:hypothetical protein